MAVLTGQAKIDAQAKVTALAIGTTNASNELISQSDFLISQANRSVTINPNVGVRFGGNDPDPIAVANSKSSLTIQKIDIRKRITYNREFITLYSDETKSWVNDPAITSARQQVQIATFALETSLAKIDETLAILNGAGPQIQDTAAPAAPTQDTASRDVTNTTSPATLAAGTSTLPTNQLSNLVKNSGTNLNAGAAPDVSNKIESAIDAAKPKVGTNLSINTGVSQAVKQNPDAVDASKPLPNILHQYPSYTYGLSLHLLNKDEYNKVVEKQEYIPKRVLIASAGRYNNTPGPNQFIRSPYFQEDFYFENFELETVIGLNEHSRNSNAIKYQFTLVEPQGFTLIERILQVCDDPDVSSENYLDMPYLIQIDFFGIDDSGVIVGAIPNTTKYVPVRINKMEVKITGRGAEYSIEGTPYNHSAFDLSTITTPANFEIEAETVAQFFQSNESSGGLTDTTGQRETSQGTLWKTTSGQLIGPDGTIQYVGTGSGGLLSRQTLQALGLNTSYGTALNSYNKAAFLANKIGANDIYKFKFIDCDDIANSPFVDPDTISQRDTRMVSPGNILPIKKSNLGFNTNEYNPNRRIFQVNAGTYIDRVIAWIVRNSKFMLDQINIPDGELSNANPNEISKYLSKQAELQDKSFFWIKVVPTIKLLEFDRLRKIWAREITYNIQKYEVKNLKVDVGPQGIATTYVKDYNYIYTGQNIDIIDLDIQFNALYYNALTIYRDAMADAVAPNSVIEENKSKNVDDYRTKNPSLNQDPNAIMPLVIKPIVLDARQRTGSGSYTSKSVALADVEASLMTLSQGDMLHVMLKIIGDPDFIKQDDIFYPPMPNSQVTENKTSIDPRLTPNGSLRTDRGEVYVNLTFRTPVDIDETTGLMSYKLNGKDTTKKSLFSGIYRIMTVKNEFRNGQFIQTLNLVRLVRQKNKDNVTNKAPATDERNLVPGQRAVLNDYLQGPNYTAPDVPKAVTNEDGGTQSAQQALANTQAEESLISSEQQNLRNVNQLATEQPINNQNEPATVPDFTPISVRGNQVPGAAAI
jgi:hypothetical protein